MSSLAKRACSNKNKHVALTPQGGQQSPLSGQTPSLCHIAQTRQYYPKAVTTGTMTTGQIQSDT
jgi:hypothetical protein